MLSILSFEKLLQEKEELETEFLAFRREVSLTTTGAAAKEVRLLKDLVKTLERDLREERNKNQRASAKRSQECRQLLDEVGTNIIYTSNDNRQ